MKNVISEKLSILNQSHLLKFIKELSETDKQNLINQIETLDFSVLHETGAEEERGNIEPLYAATLSEIENKKEIYRKTGIEAIRNGKVGAVLLAGGQGSRLGFDKPKGMFNIGVNRELYIFECLINNLLDVVKETETWIPLFVMTSVDNDKDTRDFFEEHNYFGYSSDNVMFFVQEQLPTVDTNGKLMLAGKGTVSTAPNGNGGWYSSMYKWGIAQKAMADGVEWLNVFAVDNVLQRIADPCFVGATISTGSAVGAKVVKKNAPDEKVGAMCLEDGRPSIVEYYEMTEELMNAKDAQGEPAYNFGVILNYLFREKDLEEIVAKKLPLHIVEKKIPYLNEQGELVKPEEPNGYKFEQLVLDMIHELDSCLPYEVVREKEFAPIKNKEGVDSVESARALLEKNGVKL